MVVAERLREAVEKYAFRGKDCEPIRLTISVGVAQFPLHSCEPEGLIMAADLAMYQSKSMGRNRVTLFSQDSSITGDGDTYALYLLLHATDMATIEAVASAVDAKSKRYQGFSHDVMLHSTAVGREVNISDEEMRDLYVGSLLHDIGKLGIPDDVLNKQGELTLKDAEILRSHPLVGHSIVQKAPHLKTMLPAILSHHERWDGKGYPAGLAGPDIPLIARIIAVLDSYHAMLCQRPHRDALTPEEAKAEVLRCSGTQFDPSIVEAFMRVLDREEHERMIAA